MTPEEKAKDITQRFFSLQEMIEWGDDDLKEETNSMYLENQIEYDSYYYNLAKASALMYVNDVLNLDCGDAIDKNYYEEVELEIKKL